MTGDIDIRDRCCWLSRRARCTQESDMIFYGAGLCDEHWSQACSVYLPTLDYLLGRGAASAGGARVVPEAAATMRAQDAENKARAKEKKG